MGFTLRDSKVTWSRGARILEKQALRDVKRSWLTWVLFIVSTNGGALTGLVFGWPFGVAFFLSTVALGLLLHHNDKLAKARFLERERQIESGADVSALGARLRMMRAGFDMQAGALIVGTRDELWEAAVLEVIDNADALFIDVSEVSDNMKIELKAAASKMPAEAIVLAWGVGKLDDDTKLPVAAANAVESAFGEAALHRFKKFPYLKNVPFAMSPDNLVRRDSPRLRELLLDAIDARREAQDPLG